MTASIDRLGWHEESGADDERWPLRYRGTTQGIEWTLSVCPALENPDGPKLPDTIWWATDAVTSASFQAVIGYARAGTVDWTGQGGVKHYEQLADATDAILAEIGEAAEVAIRTADRDFVRQLEAIEQRRIREYPWLTIGPFIDSAHHVSLDDPRLEDVEIKAADATVGCRVLSQRVLDALAACKAVVNDSNAFLRVWLGAPNLRISVGSVIADEDERTAALENVVELGIAIADAWRSPARQA